jgi:F-type H+-transporting ATPase subunit b
MKVDLTTFVFEIINFLVLLWLLQRLVYRPLRDGIARRRKALEEREQAAERAMLEAERLQEQRQHEREELAQLRDQVVREANEEAAEQRARILASAREDAEAERARVYRLLESERSAALSWVNQVAVERGTEVAGMLLMQLAPEAVEDALFEQLRKECERRDLSDSELSDPPEVEVSAASVPDNEKLNALRDSLERGLGKRPQLVVREEPALRAGTVVRVGRHVLDASVAGQLDVFRERVKSELEREAPID